MYNKKRALYQLVIIDYFNNHSSLRKTAAKYGLHYQTVYNWVKKYKSDKNNYSFAEHKVPWNRTRMELEKKIVRLKEKFPWFTIHQIRKMLIKQGFKLSYHCVWEILRRYGYCGFNTDKISNDFTDFISFTKENQAKFFIAQKLYDENKINESAKVLNTITSLPKNELILKIHDESLSIPRKIEKLMIQFGRINLTEYLMRTMKLYKECRSKHLNYSALRIGLALLAALSYSGNREEQQKWTKKIEELLPCRKTKARDLIPIRYTLLMLKCHTLVQMMRITEAQKLARYCFNIVTKHKKPLHNLVCDLAIQFIDLEDYNTAEKLLLKSLEGIDEQRKKRLKMMQAIYIHLLRCDKKNALRLLNEAKIYDWTKEAQLSRFQALFALIEGQPFDALNLAQNALNISKEAGLFLDIANAYAAMASAYMCLGETKKAKILLKELKKFLRKIKMQRQLLGTNILLKKFPANKKVLKLSTFKLAWLLKQYGYITAYKYALKKGLMFYFYRYLFFYPEIVQKRLAKNKPTFLPKTILRLPIFNTEPSVYHIKLLGSIIVFRNQKYLKIHLSPKDTVILLFIASKIYEPEKSLNLNELYKNFWQNKSDSPRLFSHSLVRIKKALKIPAHYLEVKREGGESFLMNHNLYFTTDYQEFEQTLARAKALERAGEWGFAKKEYLQAFKLFRGEPFKKNFDNWSVDMRFKILTKFETEAIAFAKSCIEHRNKADARKILQKVLKIIPDSEEAKRLLDSLMTG